MRSFWDRRGASILVYFLHFLSYRGLPAFLPPSFAPSLFPLAAIKSAPLPLPFLVSKGVPLPPPSLLPPPLSVALKGEREREKGTIRGGEKNDLYFWRCGGKERGLRQIAAPSLPPKKTEWRRRMGGGRRRERKTYCSWLFLSACCLLPPLLLQKK